VTRLLELATWALLAMMVIFEWQAALVGDWRGMLAWAIAAAATIVALGITRVWR